MKKSTFKTYLILLLVFLLCIAVALTAFACNNTDEEPVEAAEETKTDFESLVSNGDFSEFTSGSAQPYSHSSWSSYTSSETNSDNKVAGIIDTGADYDANRATWGDLANPYGTVTANKVLMIYNKEENVYGYTNSFSTTAYAYYSVSVKVKVVNVDADHGASIRISNNNEFAMFDKINATDAFTTYTFYVQSPCIDSTITVRLSLGYDDQKVKGYAFFDDVVAKKITKKDYTDATESATVKKASMLYPDGEFNYYTFSSTDTALKTPVAWTWKDGDNVAGKAVPTSDRFTGVISTDEESWKTVEENYGSNPGVPAGATDSYVMAIIKNETSAAYSPTAGYFNSNNKISIDRSTLYEISVWVKAIVTAESDAKKGARVVLKGTDKYESAVVNMTGNETNNGWAKVTFYVLGNQFRAEEFNIQLWIGNDKANDTLTQGRVYFDDLTITPLQSVSDANRATVTGEYEAKAGSFETEYVSYVEFVDLKTENDKLIVNESFTALDEETGLPTALEMGAVKDVKVKMGVDVIADVITAEDFANENTDWKEKFGIDENPSYPYTFDRVLIVNNVIPSAYEVKTKNTYKIEKSLSYRISVWIKTIGIAEDKNVTLKLVTDEDKEISSFTVNTAKYENEATNNYVEYCFYLTGEMPTSVDNSDQSHEVRIVISNGSGTQYDPSSYQKGAFLIANINMEQITYTDYESNTSSSSTYSASKDYATKRTSSDPDYNPDYDPYDSTVSNGNFNIYKRKDTTFDDETGFVAMTDKDGNGNLTGAIESWTNNVDKKYGTTKVEGEWLDDTYHITKVESGENENDHFDAAIQGKTITTITITGNYEKTFENATDWNAVFDINAETGKVAWKSGNTFAVGTFDVKIKVTEGWLEDTYHITKVESGDNDNADFTADIVGKTITEIKVTGTIDKTYNSETEWSNVFDINAITGRVKWKSSNTLPATEYTVKIKVDEKELNDLIAGIININASDAYLAQFGLTKDAIYDQWSASVSDKTAAKNVGFGAPNLLMITTRAGVTGIKLKNTVVNGKTTNDVTDKPAVKSSDISLSANSFYHFKCYAKAIGGAIGQVYVTTTSTDTKITKKEVNLADGWVEYNFYVETGMSSVSAYFELYYGVKGDGDTEYSGTLLFDSFSYVSIEEDEYLATAEEDRATFTTVTFDNDSAGETAVSPNGFTGTNSNSKNSDELVSGIIAKDRYAYTTSAGKNNLGIYNTVTKEDGTTEVVLDEDSSLSASYIFDSTGMTDGAEVGDYLLLINNRKDTYQSYYKSLSLSSDSCYKFSVYVRTAKIAKDSYAKVYVSISDEPMTFEVNTEYDKDGNSIENKWQKLTFYYKNEKDSSVSASLYFQLGENTDAGKMKGYLFIDNVSLSKITENEYNDAKELSETYEKDENDEYVLDANGEKILTAESLAYRANNKVTVLEKDAESTDDKDDEEKDKDEEEPGSSLNTTLLWTYITSIAIAVVLIAVIVVWLIKKYRRPKAASSEQKKADYDRNNKKSESANDTATKTGSARDEFKD